MVVARANAMKKPPTSVAAKRQRILDRLNARKVAIAQQSQENIESQSQPEPAEGNIDCDRALSDSEASSDSGDGDDASREQLNTDSGQAEGARTALEDTGQDIQKSPEARVDELGDSSGFTVLESAERAALPIVHRTLPYWLQHPTLAPDQRPLVTDCEYLPQPLRERLLERGVERLFPVQSSLVPYLLSPQGGFGQLALTPRDVCVSAPTGSGKTLAFVLPLLSALYRGGASKQVFGGDDCCRGGCRARPCLRALVVLPTQTLAAQVSAVFRQMACEWSELRVLLLGADSLARERAKLVCEGPRGVALCRADVIVATPGRLVDHIRHTAGFSLRHLRYIVIDEADRVMEMAEAGWLRTVESSARASEPQEHPLPSRRPLGQPLTAASVCGGHLPLQKLLFSATLSQNAEKLATLQLVAPRLFVVAGGGGSSQTELAPTPGHFVGRYTTPAELHESFLSTAAELKPLQLLHMLLQPPLKDGVEGSEGRWKRTLVFTNSCRSAHRLCTLLSALVPANSGLAIGELSSRIPAAARRRVLTDLTEGAVAVLVCSDGAARGLDVPAIDTVVCYDLPTAARTYIHRAGRTARAGRRGRAVTILAHEQRRHFERVLVAAGKNIAGLEELTPASTDQLSPHVERYKEALQKLRLVVDAEKREHRSLSGTTKVVRCRRKRNTSAKAASLIVKSVNKKRRTVKNKSANVSK